MRFFWMKSCVTTSNHQPSELHHRYTIMCLNLLHTSPDIRCPHTVSPLPHLGSRTMVWEQLRYMDQFSFTVFYTVIDLSQSNLIMGHPQCWLNVHHMQSIFHQMRTGWYLGCYTFHVFSDICFWNSEIGKHRGHKAAVSHHFAGAGASISPAELRGPSNISREAVFLRCFILSIGGRVWCWHQCIGGYSCRPLIADTGNLLTNVGKTGWGVVITKLLQ